MCFSFFDTMNEPRQYKPQRARQRVHWVRPHHVVEGVSRQRLVRLLEDTLEQQRVLGESLVGLGHHVGQFEPVALLVRLPPLDGRTHRDV